MRRAWVVLLALAAVPACGSRAELSAVDAPVRATAVAEVSAETREVSPSPPPAPPAPAAAAPVAASSSAAPPAAAAPAAVADPGEGLRGRTFMSTAVQQDGQPRPLLQGTALTVVFEETTVRWQAGCNAMGADVRITPDVLDVLEPIAGTSAGCDAEREAQDAWTTELFGGDPRWALEGGRLTLTRGGTVVVLEQTG